jgi:ribonuclease D
MHRRPPATPDLPEQTVTDADALGEVLDHIAAEPVVGLDTEFVGEESYRPELCLVQVSTPSRLILLDPYACGDLSPFWELLTDPKRVTVVHAGREEVRMCKHAIGRPPANVYDLQIACALVGMTYPIGYAGLVQEVLKARMNKGETLTDWRRRPLTPNQVRYAFDDVRYLLPLWANITGKLKKLKRGPWAVEEFRAFTARAVRDDALVEKWRKLKGVGALDRQELAIAREVYGWRDSFAARVNRPPRVLLRDDIIVEIARGACADSFDLQSMRGIPRGETEVIAAAIRRAVALPASERPELQARDYDPPHVATLSGFLGLALADFCRRERIAPTLAATMSDVRQIVRRYQPDGSDGVCALDRGWRAAAVRPYLESILNGSMVLRVVDPGGLNPVAVVPWASADGRDDQA